MSDEDVLRRVRRLHGSLTADVVRSALEEYKRETPDDLCSVLRRDWDRYDGAKTIAQAIDLGLGAQRARQVLFELSRRDLSYDKIG